MKLALAALAVATLSLAACTEPDTPKGDGVAAAMPDTGVARDANAEMTAPDAAATGSVPADGSTPPAAPLDPQANAPATNAPAAK